MTSQRFPALLFQMRMHCLGMAASHERRMREGQGREGVVRGTELDLHLRAWCNPPSTEHLPAVPKLVLALVCHASNNMEQGLASAGCAVYDSAALHCWCRQSSRSASKHRQGLQRLLDCKKCRNIGRLAALMASSMVMDMKVGRLPCAVVIMMIRP